VSVADAPSSPAALAAAAAVLGGRAQRDEPLGPRTTYRVGGPAALLLEVAAEADLALAADAVAAAAPHGGLATLVVGNGSNLLVADDGFRGLALVLGEAYSALTLDPDRCTARAGGGLALPVLARRTARAGLRGLEWAVGVPGTVGGAVRMNAGGHGSDTAATLRWVRAFDLESGHDEVVPVADLDLGYRRSSVRPSQLVLEAEFQLVDGDADAASAEVSEIVRWRRANQPGGQNAGSVFTNPPGDAAGRLVDAAGCRGLRLGTAEVSDKHANFIQADPEGRADDVAALIAEVRRRVAVASGVDLHPEVRLVGFPDPSSEVEG
jgi:UDP-N-acetylmuramate dehydrogenase